MQFQYHYPHYYLPLERNQDDGWGVKKSLPLYPMVGLPMDTMAGILINPKVVIHMEIKGFLTKDIPRKQMKRAGLVDL